MAKKAPVAAKARKLNKNELKKVKGGEDCMEYENTITIWKEGVGWTTQTGTISDCPKPAPIE